MRVHVVSPCRETKDVPRVQEPSLDQAQGEEMKFTISVTASHKGPAGEQYSSDLTSCSITAHEIEVGTETVPAVADDLFQLARKSVERNAQGSPVAQQAVAPESAHDAWESAAPAPERVVEKNHAWQGSIPANAATPPAEIYSGDGKTFDSWVQDQIGFGKWKEKTWRDLLMVTPATKDSREVESWLVWVVDKKTPPENKRWENAHFLTVARAKAVSDYILERQPF